MGLAGPRRVWSDGAVTPRHLAAELARRALAALVADRSDRDPGDEDRG